MNRIDLLTMKLLHYFITELNYKPIIVHGLDNEIWLENMEKDLQLIRINTNYIHNEEQLKNDMYKVKTVMRSIKKTTLSLRMNVLNLLLDTNEDVDFSGTKEFKHVETVKIDKINDFKRNKVVSNFFPNVKNNILNDKMDPIDFFKLTDDMNQKTIKNEKKLAKIFSQKKPVLTYLLIVINVMMFMFQFVFPGLKSALCNNYIGVQKGQIYRLFTCMFLHGDIIHLLCNMFALYTVGPQVERYYGKRRFAFIYFISGVLGSLFSSVFMSEFVAQNGGGVGASGAIFGLVTSVGYFSYYYRATLQDTLKNSITPVLASNLLLSLMVPQIGFAGHIGGLIGGLLTSMAIGIGDKGRKSDQINGVIVLILMYIFMIYMLIGK